MNDHDKRRVPVHDDGFSPRQNVVWKSAAVGWIVSLIYLGMKFFDISDPVIAVILSVWALIGVWGIRKYVRSSLTDEKIEAMGRRIGL